MERIHYAGSSVLTGSAIARSLVHYAEALAQRRGSAAVRIPVRLEDGGIGSADLLIGPASQLLSEPEESDAEEIVDDELVERMDREAGRLGVSHPVAEADDEIVRLPDLDLPEYDDEGR